MNTDNVISTQSKEAAYLAALKQIEDLAAPGQELGISDAIDLICDIYNVARAARQS